MERKTKDALKPWIPGFLLALYHRIRLAFLGAKKTAHRGIHRGDGLVCNFCGKSSKSFLESGNDFPILEKWAVQSTGKRNNALCPNCDSKDRERTLKFFLERNTKLFDNKTQKNKQHKILHIAPEKELSQLLKKQFKDNYVSGDLDPEAADQKIDITKIDFSENSFDAIICNHVLEHIPKDNQAISELYRVLKPGGFAILQVPISFNTAKTIEDFAITSPAGREEAFGQFDHVRIYGRDYVNRLEQGGWEVRLYYPEDFISEAAIQQYALIEGEPIFYCEKTDA